MQKLCKQFPRYTLWLMTGQTQQPKQSSPELDTLIERKVFEKAKKENNLNVLELFDDAGKVKCD